MPKQFIRYVLCLIALCASHVTHGGNIDLSTLPQRDSVQLTIYNSEDLTLVQETRTMSFKAGTNKLQFSWANTLIDPTSVELRFLQQADTLHIQQTTFPHDRQQMLFWTVNSDIDSQVKVEISYFTSGIAWSADYVGVANPTETQMNLEAFVTVHNKSGENYENANVRLVVGTIHLVDNIAALSQPQSQSRNKAKDKLRRRLMRKNMPAPTYPAMAMSLIEADYEAPKEIAKAGLSEYYIYTIEGEESIPNGWSKRMPSFSGDDIPISVAYRYRPREYGNQLVKLFIFENTKKSKLGTTPMPEGQVRLFKRNQQSLEYLAGLTLKYVSIGDKVELNLGQDPEVEFKEVKLQSWRDNVWMRYRKGQIHRRIRDKKIKVDHRATVSGWNDHSIYTQRIRNFSARDIHVEWRKPYSGDVVYSSELNPSLHDHQTVQVKTQVPAQSTQENVFQLTTKQGKNQKQSHIQLKTTAVNYPDFATAIKR